MIHYLCTTLESCGQIRLDIDIDIDSFISNATLGDILSYIQIRLDQRAPRDRAVEERRHGESRLRPHVLQQGLSALAGPQGEYQNINIL